MVSLGPHEWTSTGSSGSTTSSHLTCTSRRSGFDTCRGLQEEGPAAPPGQEPGRLHLKSEFCFFFRVQSGFWLGWVDLFVWRHALFGVGRGGGEGVCLLLTAIGGLLSDCGGREGVTGLQLSHVFLGANSHWHGLSLMHPPSPCRLPLCRSKFDWHTLSAGQMGVAFWSWYSLGLLS